MVGCREQLEKAQEMDLLNFNYQFQGELRYMSCIKLLVVKQDASEELATKPKCQ